MLRIDPWDQSSPARLSIDEMTRVLRERICLTAPDVEIVLYETELSREFSVSRTPIRQVLQRLAYEQLVRTVSGVGTVVVPMSPADRPVHMQTHLALLRLIASQGGVRADVLDEPGPLICATDYLRVRGRLAERVTSSVTDPILEASLAAALWRDVRWSVHDFDADKNLDRLGVAQTVAMYWSKPVHCLHELTQFHAVLVD